MYRDKFVNQINKHYWIGVFTGIGIGAIYFLIPPMIDIFMSSPKQQVADTYKGCNTKEKRHHILDCIRRD